MQLHSEKNQHITYRLQITRTFSQCGPTENESKTLARTKNSTQYKQHKLRRTRMIMGTSWACHGMSWAWERLFGWGNKNW